MQTSAAAMPAVELVYETSCPHVGAARGRLLRAFAVAGVTPCWTEWDVNAAETPAHLRPYGSPTILVDGRDVAGADATPAGACCRIYPNADGTGPGAPPLAAIVEALRASIARPT